LSTNAEHERHDDTLHHVGQGKVRNVDVVLADLDANTLATDEDDRPRAGDEGVRSKHDTLGQTGCAAGVADGHHVVLGDGAGLCQVGFSDFLKIGKVNELETSGLGLGDLFSGHLVKRHELLDRGDLFLDLEDGLDLRA